MSRKQVTLESVVRDYFLTHTDMPEFPEDVVGTQEDCTDAQTALEQEIVPELETYRQQSEQLYDMVKALLNPAGQQLLGELWQAQANLTSAYETLAWHMGGEVQRQLLLTPSLN